MITVQNIFKYEKGITTLPIRIKHASVIIALVALMFLSDAANTILLKTDNHTWRVSIIIRGIALIYFIALLISYRNGRAILGYIALLLFIFLIGGIAEVFIDNNFYWFENLNLLFKLSFIFVSWEVLRKYITDPVHIDRLFRLFEILILIESFSVIVGFLFKLDIFSSYGQEYRFGYKGIIPAQNEVSGFFLIAIFYYLWKVASQRKGIIPLMIVLLAGFLTGAKVALLFPLLLIIYLLIWTKRFLSRSVFWFLCLFLLIMIPVALWNMDYIIERVNPTFQYFNYQLNVGNNPNYFSIFMSGRDIYIHELVKEIFTNKGFFNIFFGGHNLSVSSTETDFLDVFLFIGTIGLIIFYLLYLKILLNPRNGMLNKHQLIFACVWIGVSSVAGHLIFSAINSMYLAILLLAYSSYQIKEFPQNENGPTTNP